MASSEITDLPDSPNQPTSRYNFPKDCSERKLWWITRFRLHGFVIGNGYTTMKQMTKPSASTVSKDLKRLNLKHLMQNKLHKHL